MIPWNVLPGLTGRILGARTPEGLHHGGTEITEKMLSVACSPCLGVSVVDSSYPFPDPGNAGSGDPAYKSFCAR